MFDIDNANDNAVQVYARKEVPRIPIKKTPCRISTAPCQILHDPTVIVMVMVVYLRVNV